MTFDYQVEEGDDHERILKSWGVSAVKFKDIMWMNKTRREHKRPQLAYIAYGNEASISEDYSYCAIISHVPGIDIQSGARVILPAADSESESDCADEEKEMENAMAMDEEPEPEPNDDDPEYEGGKNKRARRE